MTSSGNSNINIRSKLLGGPRLAGRGSRWWKRATAERRDSRNMRCPFFYICIFVTAAICFGRSRADAAANHKTLLPNAVNGEKISHWSTDFAHLFLYPYRISAIGRVVFWYSVVDSRSRRWHLRDFYTCFFCDMTWSSVFPGKRKTIKKCASERNCIKYKR